MAAVSSALASVIPSGEIAAEDYDYVVVIPGVPQAGSERVSDVDAGICHPLRLWG